MADTQGKGKKHNSLNVGVCDMGISSGLNLPLKSLWHRVYRLYAVRGAVQLGQRVHIGIGSILWAPNHLEIQDDVYIGKFCTIECDGRIGADTMIANNVGLIGRYDHDFRCVGRPIRKAPWIGDADYNGLGKNLSITIDQDVWVGFGSVLLTGVHVGRGAIVAAGSVVTQDVEPYAIVAGVPAKKMAWRFDTQDIERHEGMLRGTTS